MRAGRLYHSVGSESSQSGDIYGPDGKQYVAIMQE